MVLHVAALMILAASLPYPEAVAAAPLLTSPLFGNSLGGGPFDDGTTSMIPGVARLHAVFVCHGDMVDGIQLVYMLQDNGTFVAYPHGKVKDQCGKDSNMSKIVFKEGETLGHIEGLTQKTWRFVSQLSLFTSVNGGPPKLRGKPFGRGGTSDTPFSLTGDIRGIFGRSGDLLDSVGFYISNANLPLSSYRKTDLIGVNPGTIQFDDFELLASKDAKPLKITNMIICHSEYINAIQVTYLTSTGAPISLVHGNLKAKVQIWSSRRYCDVLDFDDDEWITRVNISPRYGGTVSNCIGSLELETTNSKGSVRSYGPFGQVYTSNVTSIAGVVHGFYGSYMYYLTVNTIGFYV